MGRRTGRKQIIADLAKKMGDAGYCNYAACAEYLEAAYAAGAEWMREEAAEKADDMTDYPVGKAIRALQGR